MLLNLYGVDMGTQGLILQAQSREEIYADKLLAFALRPNRVKYRDLWDIAWLHGQNIQPRLTLIPQKTKDRNLALSYFVKEFQERNKLLTSSQAMAEEFKQEMRRFIPSDPTKKGQDLDSLWLFIVQLMSDISKQI